jgi:hypothetical protein
MAAATALALAGAAASVYGALKRPKDPAMPAIPELPAAPDVNAANEAKGAALSRKKGKALIPGTAAAPKGGTLLTGPSGLIERAATTPKTLLGS